MKYNFKEEAARQGTSGVEITGLSKLGPMLTADNLTDISNDARAVNLGRVIDALEIVGTDPGEFVSGMSGNTPVYSNILEGQRGGLSADARKKAAELSDKYCLSESCMKLREKAESTYGGSNVLIYGMPLSGKFSMLQYLINAHLDCTGPVISRDYKNAAVLAQDCAGVSYVYPVSGYIYENDDSSCIPEFLSMSRKEKEIAQKKLGLPCYGKMNDANKDYIIFHNASVLNNFSFICSSFRDDETAAEHMRSADIMMIMLSESAEFIPKLTQLLSSAKEKWNERMAEHMLFIIPKADRYPTDDTEISGIRKISDVKAAYKSIIAECVSHICDDGEGKDKLADSLGGQIVPFSSIYKSVTSGVCDASHNFEFDNAVKLCVKAAAKEKELGRQKLREEIDAYSHETVCLTPEQMKDIMTELNSNFSREISRMKEVISNGYDKLMNVAVLSALIKENGLTRTKEGRQKVISLVNSRLSDMALEAIDETLFRIYRKVRDMELPTDNKAVSDKLEETVLRGISRSNNKKIFISAVPGADKDSKAGNTSAAAAAAAGMGAATMAASLIPVAAILGPIAGIAGTVVSSYYAQTNFEKNTARKIVAAYDENKVKDNLTRKLISSRIVPVQQEAAAVVESFGRDDELKEYAAKLSEVLAD